MPSKHQVLLQFGMPELRALVRDFEIEVRGRLSKEQLCETLAASRSIRLSEILRNLPIGRLRQFCIELSLDASGRKKEPLIERLSSSRNGPREHSSPQPRVRKRKASADALTSQISTANPESASRAASAPEREQRDPRTLPGDVSRATRRTITAAPDPASDGTLRIPNRFESLQEAFGQDVRPLIVPVDSDLHALAKLATRARVQNGGLMCFLLGETGVGKTTAAHSAVVHMPETFAPVLRIPPEIEFRDVTAWLQQHIQAPSPGKTQILLFDGRELSDDEVGLKQLLSSLNQILRRRSDLLFCWPATDVDWYTNIRSIAIKIGGANFCPSEAVHRVVGPSREKWPTVLNQVLRQFGKTCEDLGLGPDLIDGIAESESRVGDFLTRIGVLIAERVTSKREIKRLPQLIFVISSSADIVGEANRIRRAGTQMLAPEPLLGYSPRSEVGKWWSQRGSDPNHHLGYIISLFDARLVTMTASAVIHACMHYGNDGLRRAASENGGRADKGNARRTIEASEFYRFLLNDQDFEFTTGRKGGLRASTSAAYGAIQRLSAKQHKAINFALCSLTREFLEGAEFELEVAQGRDIFTDAIFRFHGRPFSLEFHHLSEQNCSAANMASYMMDKLRTYAWHHQLIPR